MKKILILALLFMGCDDSVSPEDEEPPYISLEWISWSSSQCYTTTDDCDIMFGGEKDNTPETCDKIKYYYQTETFHCTNIDNYGFTEINHACQTQNCWYE